MRTEHVHAPSRRPHRPRARRAAGLAAALGAMALACGPTPTGEPAPAADPPSVATDGLGRLPGVVPAITALRPPVFQLLGPRVTPGPPATPGRPAPTPVGLPPPRGTPILGDAWHQPAKPKLEVLPVYLDARHADTSPAGGQVKPMVVVYNSTVPGAGGQDVFAAVSYDDGATWSATNLSRSAARTSFTRPDGRAVSGDTTKAVVTLRGTHLLVTWESFYCPDPAPGAVDPGDDPMGVAGAQGQVDYAAQGFPGVGVLPYRCLWAARGGVVGGAVVWLGPEQLTSGVRDALQDNSSGIPGVGFAIAWQEDPWGLRPGEGSGQGEGWMGASVNPGTDLWYTRIAWADFLRADPGDPTRPAVPFAPPVRMTDNAPCYYGEVHPGTLPPLVGSLPTYGYCATRCVDHDSAGFCVDASGRALTGRTGASRASLALVPATDAGGTKGAAAVLGWEESKGGVEGQGKHAMYLSWPRFDAPTAVASGDRLDLPGPDGEENARRVRLIVQSPGDAGPGGTRVVALYRQGLTSPAGPADVFMRRAVDGYGFAAFVPGAVNVSSGRPTPTGQTWPEHSLLDPSGADPADDAKAHRAVLRGSFLAVAYTWTGRLDRASRGEAGYDVFVRRSFDGGASFTAADGFYEPPRRISDAAAGGYTAIEPRLVGTPGSLLGPGGAPVTPDDRRDPTVLHLVFGTAPQGVVPAADVGRYTNLWYARTADAGEGWSVQPSLDPVAPDAVPGLLAGGAPAQVASQARSSPGGDRLDVVWTEADASGTRVMWRRLSDWSMLAP